MESKIINLTRSIIPRISANSKENIRSINSLPEMVLSRMIRNGNKSILRVDMNQCGAAIIKKNGINTVYTDALCGCNSVGTVIKLKNGQMLMVLSHYVPTNTEGQINALSKQLKLYEPYIDKNSVPQLFFNIRGIKNYNGMQTCPNSIIDGVKKLYTEFFNNGINTTITPYQTTGRCAFFSSANIFQFDPANLNMLKITNVGEKESFIDLTKVF